MQVQLLSNPKVLTLSTAAQIGRGGEACIYEFLSEWAAKIYHHPSPSHFGKLQAMLANPPVDPMAVQHHHAIAWPSDLLYSAGQNRKFLGFVMPRVQGMRPIMDFYHRKTRKKKCPLFHYGYLLRTARNLTTAVQALHERGYVLGDINESNILVADTALVTLVDTDSFQVHDHGQIHRCPVGKAEFTPPELQGKDFRGIDRTSVHDCFGLAVLIFQLLMEGVHPFSGTPHQPDDSPLETRIANGHFPHGTRYVPYSPKPLAPPFSMLTLEIQSLFVKCFERGHLNPKERPDTHAWQQALEAAEAALIVCPANPQHRFGNHLTSCPWCALTRQLGGHDPFPSQSAIDLGDHLLKIAPARTPLVSSVRAAARPVIGRPPARRGYSPPPGYPRRPHPRPGARGPTRGRRWPRPPLLVGVWVLLAGIILYVVTSLITSWIADRPPAPLASVPRFPNAPTPNEALTDNIPSMLARAPRASVGIGAEYVLSPRGDIRIDDIPVGNGVRIITLADVNDLSQAQLLFKYHDPYYPYYFQKPEVLMAFDERSLVVNERKEEEGGALLYTCVGGLGPNRLRFEPVEGSDPAAPKLRDRAWSFYAANYRHKPILPKSSAYCPAVAWERGSENLVLQITHRPGAAAVDSTPWYCRYNLRFGRFLAISPLDGFRTITAPAIAETTPEGGNAAAYEFISSHLQRENTHEMKQIIASYADYVDFADGKPPHRLEDLETDYKNDFDTWGRSRRDLISPVTLTRALDGQWLASFRVRCRKESDSLNWWYEAEETHVYRFKLERGRFQITQQSRTAQREDRGKFTLVWAPH